MPGARQAAHQSGQRRRRAKRDTQFASIIEIACRYDKPVRIGVNWGSLDQSVLARIMDGNARRAVPLDAGAVMREALVTSALESAIKAEEYGLGGDKIILSAKVSSVQDLIAVYRDLSARCDYPLHLGLTEAGWVRRASWPPLRRSRCCCRKASATPSGFRLPPSRAVREPRRWWWRRRSCRPWGCGHFSHGYGMPGLRPHHQHLLPGACVRVQAYVRDKMPQWRDHYDGVENMTLAVMGCVVNGPGESKHANIGISLPGTGETPAAPVFEDGVKTVTLRGDRIASEFVAIIEAYVDRTYQKKNVTA